jgi:hypothetical protein
MIVVLIDDHLPLVVHRGRFSAIHPLYQQTVRHMQHIMF